MGFTKFYIGVIAILCADLTSYYASITLAYFSRTVLDVFAPDIIPFELGYVHFLELWWIPLIFLSFFAYEGLYAKRFLFWDEVKEILKTVTISGLVLFSLVSLAKIGDQVSRVTLLFLLLYMGFLIPILRHFAKKILLSFNAWEKKVLIYGDSEFASEVVSAITIEKNLGWSIGLLADASIPLSSLPDRDFDIVILALPQVEPNILKELSAEASKFAKIVYAIPDIKGVALPNADLYRIYARQLLLIKLNNNLKNPTNKAIKWLLDRVMFVMILPILVLAISLIAVLIKLDSKGPVFYSHERIGKNGTRVRVYKFRSMYIDSAERLKKILSESETARAEWESSYKLKDDPRITKVGKYLRKYSLDELPQIFNVLLGNMSFVGPRPVLEQELAEHYKDDSRYYMSVHPGITGLWQVSGRNDTTYEMRVALDSWYVQNWSVWLDIVILFKTFKAVLAKDGAY